MLLTTPDAVALTSLQRFCQFAFKSNPSLSYYLLVVGDCEHMRNRKEYVGFISCFNAVRRVNCKIDKGLLWADRLRSSLLSQFNLSEGLYLDTDIDVIRSMAYIPALGPENYLWVPDPIYNDNRRQREMLADCNISDAGPYAQIGCMYMRKSAYSAFIHYEVKLRAECDHAFMPGTGIWNAVIRSDTNRNIGETVQCLPLCSPEYIGSATMYHWTGPIGHSLRWNASYTEDGCIVLGCTRSVPPSWLELSRLRQ